MPLHDDEDIELIDSMIPDHEESPLLIEKRRIKEIFNEYERNRPRSAQLDGEDDLS